MVWALADDIAGFATLPGPPRDESVHSHYTRGCPIRPIPAPAAFGGLRAKIARLSRLAITDAEVADYQVKLSAVVGYVERLRGLDLSRVEPMANVADSTNRLDADVPGPTLSTETLMEMAPAVMPPFVKVPKVLEEGGGA